MRSLLLILILGCTIIASAQQKRDSLLFFFESNSSVLKLTDQNKIDLEKLMSRDATSIKLFSYADTTGGSHYNLWLAERRAERIKSLLLDLYLPVEINIIGSTTAFGEQDKNRRVSVYYEYLNSKQIIEPKDDSTEASENHIEITKLSDSIRRGPTEKLTLNIAFVPGKAIIRKRSMGKVRKLIRKVKEENYFLIELHGHVCCGDDYFLSKNRAYSVQREMEKKGVDHKIIQCYGHSNRQPLVEEVNRKSRKKNRRVEVYLFKETTPLP